MNKPYGISDFDFIGESLPKIIGNFDDIYVNITSLTNNVTNVLSLSSAFYTNDSTNFTSNHYSPVLNSTMITKSSIINALTNNTKIIYPMVIYLNLKYASLPTETVDFSYKPTSTGIFTNISQNDYYIINRFQLFTFIDIGFFDWKITYPTSPSGSCTISYKYYS